MSYPESTSETETWRSVVGWEWLYEVSNQGRVLALKPRWGPPRILAGSVYSCGYMYVSLYRLGKKFAPRIHRLVAEAFLGPCQPGLQCNHIDGNKTNNRLSNLEYVTPSENQRHAVRLGLIPTGDRSWPRLHPELVVRGERQGRAKLTEDDVRTIRRFSVAGKSGVFLAKMFGVTNANISSIMRRKTWTHIP